MQLLIDSDASYLTAPKVRSRAGIYHYLGNHDRALFNGPICVLAKTIKALITVYKCTKRCPYTNWKNWDTNKSLCQ